jgi:tetratricopeptide (TPR) repeat protein
LEFFGDEAAFTGDQHFESKEYLQAAEQYQIAISKYEEAIKQDDILQMTIQPKIEAVQEKIWKAYYFGGSYQEAITALRSILARTNNEESARLIAQIYEKNLSDINSAIQVLKDYNSAKRNFDIEKKIAKYYYDDRDYQNALVWFQKAMELRQDRELISNIATLYLKMGKQEEAIKAYDDFVKTNPSSSILARTYKNMGALYEEITNTTKAIEYYEKSNSLRYDQNITLKLIDIYYEAKNYDKALTKIDLLLQKSPRNKSNGLYYRAMIRYNRKDYAGAKADFKELLKDSQYKKFAEQFIEKKLLQEIGK